ncbi:DUF302 domain-containing protein [Echinicola jeungdonensis]|uniref:DUF302 domain-containing protein n=1 Tax=Echinicola jeungdonensis TaxID=709343 RepID=A0ABV5J259_9BACT|nr:DUF302 domain-containing protein [Echinicola jeungdonensis]MDN3667828.1 DUF302 domain-containing protein [Echinicola jeungdonensis]
MNYYYNKTLKNITFEKAIEKVTDALKSQGFGVLSDIDVKATFKKKLDVNFRNYRILGACNPNFAHQAISKEDKIGVFLPCNVVVQELDNGDVEVAAVDPVASMMAVENQDLGDVATKVKENLQKVVEEL